MLQKKMDLLRYINENVDMPVSEIVSHFTKTHGGNSEMWYRYLQEMNGSEELIFYPPQPSFPNCSVFLTSAGEERLENYAAAAAERAEKTRDKRLDRKVQFASAIIGAIFGSLATIAFQCISRIIP